MDIVLADLATKTGTNLLYLFEIPDPVKRIELWLYRPKGRYAWSRPCPIPPKGLSRSESPACRQPIGTKINAQYLYHRQ